MKSILKKTICLALFAALAGCTSSDQPAEPKQGGSTGVAPDGGESSAAAKPVFSLAWSEYPSWSVFGVVNEDYNLINGKRGQLSTLEMKWGVDIELKEAGYENCLNFYATNNCDAVCVTNMDVLNPALSQASVAVLPTSTSDGADACVVVDEIKNLDDLQKHKVYGLKGTVSEYCFVRNLELAGKQEADYQFENMDPAAAAVAMQQKSADQQAIMVWNPFVLQTLKTRKDAKVLFDSTKIPGEIVDMVVVAEKSLQRPGGKEFVMCLMDAFYEFNKIVADPQKNKEALVNLGKKFSSLDAAEMQTAVEQTKFYKTPDDALSLFAGQEFPQTMKRVGEFFVNHDIVKELPKIAYGKGEGNLRVDPSYLEEFKAGKK